jgi:hypothetical protein
MNGLPGPTFGRSCEHRQLPIDYRYESSRKLPLRQHTNRGAAHANMGGGL